MNICNNCKIIIDSNSCPLCHCATKQTDIKTKELTGYPKVRNKFNFRSMFLKFYLGLAILASIILLTVDYHIFSTLSWSIIALSSIILGYIVIRTFFVSLFSTFSKLTICNISSVIYLCFLDYHLGFEKWSINYVYPSSFLLESFLILLFMIIYHREFQRFISIQFFTFIGSLISLTFETDFVLSITSIGVSGILFIVTLILGGIRSHGELSRRLHFRGEN